MGGGTCRPLPFRSIMKKVTVNTGRDNSIFNIEKVEKQYDAHYVGQFCLKDKFGGWANSLADVFWQKTPPIEGYSNYFALFQRGSEIYITSGASAVEGVIFGIRADDGEIIYSRYRHDYRSSKDGSVFIDGGRDYVRASSNKYLQLKVVDGEFYELEPGDLAYDKSWAPA